MSELLSTELIAKLTGKYWRARKRVDGSIAGRHTTPHHGHSLEFSQHRQYGHGDEIKHIDWKLFGRKEKIFIKQFQAETNLRAHIVIDASKSMSFSSAKNPSKIEYVKRAAAAVAYVLIRQNDAVGTAVASSNTFDYIPPKAGWGHFNTIISEIEKIETSGTSQIPQTLQNLAMRMKKRSLVILFSDLLGNQGQIIKSLKYLNSCYHDCTAIQILDEAEVDFPFGENNEFTDLETGLKIKGFWGIRKEYQKKIKEILEEYKISLGKSGIEYHMASTSTPIERLFSRVLQ